MTIGSGLNGFGYELFQVYEERDEEVAAFCHMLDVWVLPIVNKIFLLSFKNGKKIFDAGLLLELAKSPPIYFTRMEFPVKNMVYWNNNYFLAKIELIQVYFEGKKRKDQFPVQSPTTFRF